MMMKKLLICLSLNLLSIMPIMAFYVDNINYAITSDTTVEITGPEERDLLPSDMVIPKSVTYEGKEYSVTSIGMSAFHYCGFSSITIPNSITSLSGEAFYFCRALTSITVEGGNKIYDSRDNCNAIIHTESNTLILGCESTMIPNSVTSIASDAYGGRGITWIWIPNSVTSIGAFAFYGNDYLTSITIPSSIRSIQVPLFGNCSSLASITVESGNEMYDSRDNCNAIIETFSNTLIAGCKNTIIPNSVTSIGAHAFDGCPPINTITIPNSITNIDHDAFQGACFESIIWNAKNCNDFYQYSPFEYLGWDCSFKSFVFGNEVEHIPAYLCSGLDLNFITIPNSVISIGDSPFSHCNPFAISVDSDNKTFDSRDNCNAIIETETNTLIVGCHNTVIPHSVVDIGVHAFYGCDSLETIEIPNSVISVGDAAFSDCYRLSSVYCAANVPPTLVGEFSNKEIDTLYVPLGCSLAYKQSPWAGYFLNIIEEGDADVIDITTTSATLMWGALPDVKYYIVNVYEKNTPYAEFIVDDKGVIISENYEDGTSKASTARDLARLNVPIKKMGTDTTTNNTEYFVIQLDGLQSGTQYSYTVRGMNAKDECIYEETVQFTTLTMSAITEIFMDDQEKHTTTKILHRGNLYILHPDGSLYDMKGTKVNLKNITVR